MLAAGKSTRLYPLTLELPKCLLAVGDKTILDHQVESLVANGIKELVIVVGYHKQKIIDHLAEKNYPITITYIENDQYERNGPIIGGLRLVRNYLHEPLLFFHCDVLFTTDAIATLLANPNESVLLYRRGVWDEEAGKIIVDAEGRVQELGKHIDMNRASGEYAQIAKFGADFCERLVTIVDERLIAGRDGYTIDAFNDVVQDSSIHALGLPFGGFLMEIDTTEDYAAAQKVWGEQNL